MSATITPITPITPILPAEVVRDENGYWTHPDVPDLDEDVLAWNAWMHSHRLESHCVWLENEDDTHPAWISYFEQDDADVRAWEPKAPDGDGWFLLWLCDTEDGPVAHFVRTMAGAVEEGGAA